MEMLTFHNNQNSFMSSRDIAVATNKDHRNILRDCDKLNKNYEQLGLLKIEHGSYTHPSTGNQQHREMRLTKMQTMDLMNGYKIELRIKINRRWEELESKSKIAIPTYAEALRLAAEKTEENEKLIKENNRLHERTDFVDKVFVTDDLITGSQVCKLLGLKYGNRTLYKKLQEMGIFFKNGNEPKQNFEDKGYFRMKEVIITKKIKLQTLFTQKGLGYIKKVLDVQQPPTDTIEFIS